MTHAEFTQEPGQHDGWVRYYFTHLGREWVLLTIDKGEEKKRSSIYVSHTDQVRDQPWPNYHSFRLNGIIDVATAREIISHTYEAWNEGIQFGRKAQAAEIRKALNP